MLTQGPQFVGENCPSTAVLTKKINTRCDQVRLSNRFSRVYSPACASRFSGVDPLGNAQVQGEHQDT